MYNILPAHPSFLSSFPSTLMLEVVGGTVCETLYLCKEKVSEPVCTSGAGLAPPSLSLCKTSFSSFVCRMLWAFLLLCSIAEWADDRNMGKERQLCVCVVFCSPAEGALPSWFLGTCWRELVTFFFSFTKSCQPNGAGMALFLRHLLKELRSAGLWSVSWIKWSVFLVCAIACFKTRMVIVAGLTWRQIEMEGWDESVGCGASGGHSVPC